MMFLATTQIFVEKKVAEMLADFTDTLKVLVT